MAKFSDYPDLIAQIKPTIESNVKTAIDTANEEVGVDLDYSISLVASNYSDIKDAITAKGIDMTGVKPSGYDTQIAKIGDTYTRPSFWPELPEIAVDENGIAAEQVIYLLVAVYPDRVNKIYFGFNATCTIDYFGELPTQSLDSGYHRIFFKANDFCSEVISDLGYKIVKIALRTNSGVIAYFNTQDSNTAWDRILFIKAAFTSTNNAEINLRFLPMLEEIEIVGAPRIHGYGALGNNCRKLKKITFDTKRVTHATSFFYNEATQPCVIDIPDNTFDFSNSTTGLASTFQQQRFSVKLIKVKCPVVPFSAENLIRSSWTTELELDDMSLCTNTTLMFYDAAYLAKLAIPGIKINFSVAYTQIGLAELKRIIENDLGTPDTTATLTITGTPDAAAVMAAITAGTITVPAGWTVVN